MQRDTGGYFEYKRQKMQMNGSVGNGGNKTGCGFALRLFIFTFIIIFGALAAVIMKFSSKIDIEYSRADSYDRSDSQNLIDLADDVQRKIDKRLVLIQQEENAPSEAKILNSEKNKNQVIDPSFMEEGKKIEKAQKLQDKMERQQRLSESSNRSETQPTIKDKSKMLIQLKDEILGETQKTKEKTPQNEDNVTIMSKVVVGRYSTFEDAKKSLPQIKEKAPDLSPFVRKIGDVYGIQMGSYQEFSVARRVAQDLKIKGLDVWIYQQ